MARNEAGGEMKTKAQEYFACLDGQHAGLMPVGVRSLRTSRRQVIENTKRNNPCRTPKRGRTVKRAMPIILALACVAGEKAQAQSAMAGNGPTAKEVLAHIDSGSEIDRIVLQQTANAYLMMNSYSVNQRHNKPVFCPPTDESLSIETNINILKKYLTASPRNGDTPYYLALLYAYNYAFPCK